MPIHAIEALRRDEQKADDGPATEAEYRERLAASRRLGVIFCLLIVAAVTVASWAGWLL